MKILTAVLPIILLSCVYDPPMKGKEVSVHNQTPRPLIIIDSLTGSYFKLYDTAIVNGRKYISRRPNFITDYGIFTRLYSTQEIKSLSKEKKNTITFYFVDQANLHDNPRTIFANNLYRSFTFNIDTLKKYELNHVLVTKDTILLEHDYDYRSP